MKTNQTGPQTIDEYIASFPKDVQEILEKIRQIIREAAPAAKETIKYKMPTFVLNGRNLVYFAAFKKHIGFYPPVSTDNVALKKELSAYEGEKGSLRFPLDQPMPYPLIETIVKIRVSQNGGRGQTR